MLGCSGGIPRLQVIFGLTFHAKMSPETEGDDIMESFRAILLQDWFLRCIFWILMVTPLFFLSFTHEKGSKKRRGKRVFDPNGFSALVMLGVLIYLCYTTVQVARDVVKQDYVCVNGMYSYFAGGRNHGCVDVVTDTDSFDVYLPYCFPDWFTRGQGDTEPEFPIGKHYGELIYGAHSHRLLQFTPIDNDDTE